MPRNRCGFGKRQWTTVRTAEYEPGEVAEIDFARLGLVPDPERGGRRVAWALVVVLVHSRHQCARHYSQKIADVIDGLEEAWAWFGTDERSTPYHMRISDTPSQYAPTGRN